MSIRAQPYNMTLGKHPALGGQPHFVSIKQLWVVSPLTGVVPLPNSLNGLQMGITKYLLAGWPSKCFRLNSHL